VDDVSGVDKIYYSLGQLDPSDPTYTKLLYSIYDPSNPPVIDQEGPTTVYYYATDKAGNKESEKSTGINIDKTPPMVNIVGTSGTIWPPNKKLVPVKINGSAVDNSGLAVVKTFTFTDEYNVVTVPPITDFGQTINLIAWREGTDLDGRHYTVSVECKDAAGLTSSASFVWLVPHDMGK
jgi:hypothetical protein